MPTLDQLADQPQSKRLMIYGAPGSGKTWSIGKLATTHNLYYFSLENGHQTLFNPACVPVEARRNVHIIKMLDTPETPIAATSLDAFFKNKKGSFCDKHGRNLCAECKAAKEPFLDLELDKLTPKDILIFDSLTQWAESISFFLTRDNPDAKGDFEYYRKLGLYLGRSLARIQLIDNCSIIVISHESDTESVTGNERIVPAGGTRNFARNNSRYFDSVLHCYKENKRHKIASASTHSTVIDTKDRSDFDTSKFKDPATALLALFNPDLRESLLEGKNNNAK